jgi:hypothetical protein
VLYEYDDRLQSIRDDDLEREFLSDFVQFGASINCDSVLSIRNTAYSTEDVLSRKRLGVSALQFVYSSFEGFAILLHAILARKRGERFIQVSVSGEGQRLGSTTFPAILKRAVPARQLFAELGFVDVTADRLCHLGYDLTEASLDACFSDFAESVKNLATMADDANELKNRVKHGKAAWGLAFGLRGTDNVAHIEYANQGPCIWKLTTVSFDQIDLAAITVAKLAIRSIELAALFAAQYHFAHGDDFGSLARDAAEDIVDKARAAGLRSPGLTE